MGKLGLYDRAADLPRGELHYASRQFGGIKVYAASERALRDSIDLVCRTIDEIAVTAPALPPSYLRYLAAESLQSAIPKRTFSALLGWQLHVGRVDAVACAAPLGTEFRVIVHNGRTSQFWSRVEDVAMRLRKEGMLRIAEVREIHFSDQRQGGWNQAMFLVGRLVHVGVARYADRFTVEIPKVLQHALRRSDERFAFNVR